jgi:hypothetical protein
MTRSAAAWLGGAAAALLLVLNVASRAAPFDLASDDQGWRGWDDLAVAAGYAERGDFPVAPYVLGNRYRRRSEEFAAFREIVVEATAAAQLRPTRFWKPLPRGILDPIADWRIARRFDDMGRSVLLALGFRAIGGIAPFLILWLAPLAAVPVFLWTALEFRAAGRLSAGLVFLAAVATSAFVIDALTLGYAAVGFYLVSLLLIVPLAVYATFGQPTRRGLLLRLLAVTVPFAVCVLTRNACLATVPGYALAIAIAAFRIAPPSSFRRRAGTVAITVVFGTALLLAAWPALTETMESVTGATIQRYGQRRPMRHGHDLWSTVWQGLGDFDRTHGHVFTDYAAETTVRAAGVGEWLSPEGEAVMKRLTLRSIRSEPAWFLGILAKRAAATVTLYKLWPWPALGGPSFRPASSPNEGVIDSYYGMLSPADAGRVASHKVELPMVLWLVPACALVALALVPSHGRWRPAREEARLSLLVVACVAVAALPTPVLVTVATAFETEAFILVHHLALGLLVGVLVRRARSTP